MTKEELGLFGDGIHDDTSALQAMLDSAGEITVPDGQYLISRPLIIHDDTHLRIPRTTVLRIADHANCSLLDNDGLYRRCTNHNITVEGGVWDGNHDHQEREQIPDENQPCDYDKYVSNSLLVLMLRFVHTEHLTIRDITFRNPTTYAIHIANAKYFTVENVTLDYDLTLRNMDGVHIQGPARFGVIRNVMGDANDDHVALCTNGTARSEVTHGAIEDVDVDGIYCGNGYTGVRLLSCGDPLRNVTIRNVHGQFRLYAVSFTHHYPLRDDKPVLLQNVHLSNLFVSKSTCTIPAGQETAVQHGALVWFESGIKVRNVVVERVFRKEQNPETEAPLIRISRGADVQGIVLRDVRQDGSSRPLPLIENGAGCPIVKEL